MKKLMTMIAAVATAFGLYAADSGTSFEGSAGKLSQVYGSLTELDTTVTETTDKAKYWSFDKDDTAEVVAFGATEGRPSERPGQYVDEGNYYLKLSSGTNLLKRNYATSGSFNAALKPLYFDSVVKMTAFDADPEITDAKLAVWLRDTSEDENVVDPATNLMVTVAGVNYNCGNRPALLETWARVTIKALSIGEKIGFAVWVNETQVTCDALSYTGVTLGNDYAKQLAAEKALFVPNADDTTITYAGFAGIGSIDDLVFTETAPAFAVDYTFKTVAWDAGVTGFTCTNDQGTAFTTNGLTAFGSVTFQYTGELPAVNAASVTYAAGKMANEITNDGGVETISSQDAGVIVTINDVDTPYASANAAITAINGMGERVAATLKLQAAESAGFELDNESATIVLDLAGKTIKGENEVIKVTAGTLTITNSTQEIGKVVATATTPTTGCAVYAMADSCTLYITAGIFDGTIQGEIDCLYITGGKFLIAANEEGSLNNFNTNPDLEFVDAGDGYWELQERVAEIIATFKVDDVVYAAETNTVAFTPKAPTNPEKEGYTFTGWYPAIDMISASQEYVAQFTIKTFTVKFWNDTTLFAESNVVYGTTTAAPNPAPTKANAEFKFWATIVDDVTNQFSFATAITKNYDLYAIFEAKSTPVIDPTKPSVSMEEAAADAAVEAINTIEGRQAYITLPEAFKDVTGDPAATYKTYFNAKKVAVGDGTFKVELDLNAEGQAALQTSVDGDVVKIKPADVAAGTAKNVTIDAIPGFYYGVKAGNGIGNMAIKSSVPATGGTLKLDLPSFTGAGFYTIVASPTPMTVVK